MILYYQLKYLSTLPFPTAFMLLACLLCRPG
jgi:hypothetical protein